MPRLALSLLGAFQVTLDDRPVTEFVSDKVRALLAYLATEWDRPHSREKLAGLFWPDSNETAARASLSHALTNLRTLLAADGLPPILLADRQSVQLNPEAGIAVDAAAFQDLAGKKDVSSLRQAAELYRGRYLEGFSLPGCPEVEEWLLLEQEHVHRQAMEALARLASVCEEECELERALVFTWRQLELDPAWESAHQGAMRLLALAGRRDAALAQYQVCRRVLAEELGVEPSTETARLYEQIRDGKLAALPGLWRGPEVAPAPLPGFLTGRAAPGARPVFVAREAELARLGRYLEAALSGRGQVAFVVGGPGRGKTALLAEFARRAMEAQPDLLLAMGSGGAYAGTGDPYLPFREVLAMLTGDVEARWAAGSVAAYHARRIWEALPEVGTVLVERGAGLVGTLLPGREVLARARAAAVGEAGWLGRLARLAAEEMPARGLEQSHLFEQYSNVLLDLSEQRPLLVVIDDLQWADLASIGLLFHLSRRIERGRILIAGAYRPHELAQVRDGGRHPLEPALAGVPQRFGDVWLDLAATDEAEGRLFVDRFLDTEPNRLSAGFREALFGRTGGHALFTIELLQGMQERGCLRRDEETRWVESEELDWGRLPARAEAAIAERIDRLPAELRELLAAASVEGEEFTAQAAALVLGMDELQVLRLLRRELAARHRLVRKQGEVRLDGRSLSRYRFSHYLVQYHLYQGTDEGERRVLHLRTGEALENLYEGHLEEAAVQLARHFAGDPERERRYCKMAGERAAAQFANEEAVRYLSRALELTPEGDAGARFLVLMARESVYDVTAQREAQERDLARLEALEERLGAAQRAEITLRRSSCWADQGRYQEALAAAREVAEWSRAATQPATESKALRLWGDALCHQGEFQAAREVFSRALARARASGRRELEASALLGLGFSSPLTQGGLASCEEALRLLHNLGDRRREVVALNNLGVRSREAGDPERARALLEQSASLARDTGDVVGEALAQVNLLVLWLVVGDLERALRTGEAVLPRLEQLGDLRLHSNVLTFLAEGACRRGDLARATELAQAAQRLALGLGDSEALYLAFLSLGLADLASGRCLRAEDDFRQVLELQRQRGIPAETVQALGELARAELALGDCGEALAHIEEVVRYLDQGGHLNFDCQPCRTYLAGYQVLAAAGDPRSAEMLERGYDQLMEWAGRISDEAMRRSYLENVAENRELVRLWEEAHAGGAGEGRSLWSLKGDGVRANSSALTLALPSLRSRAGSLEGRRSRHPATGRSTTRRSRGSAPGRTANPPWPHSRHRAGNAPPAVSGPQRWPGRLRRCRPAGCAPSRSAGSTRR
ncbi:MAG TPA: BTAD domain-containing putative transcriptional regulator [Anaerolineae bacterium]|nr:BTAD domain-containing putative transcriptional regulator [Anaerolineae bacterium]